MNATEIVRTVDDAFAHLPPRGAPRVLTRPFHMILTSYDPVPVGGPFDVYAGAQDVFRPEAWKVEEGGEAFLVLGLLVGVEYQTKPLARVEIPLSDFDGKTIALETMAPAYRLTLVVTNRSAEPARLRVRIDGRAPLLEPA